MAEAVEVQKQVRSLIEAGHIHIIMNVVQVDFMDSSGLATLISLLKTARAAQGDLVLLAPSDSIRSLLELTRLNGVFTVFNTEAEALRHFSS